MNDIREWLDSLGLSQYAEAFQDGGIEWDVLPELDHDVLKELGVTLPGHRLRILKALKDLETVSHARLDPSEPASSPSHPTGEAERRQLTVMFCDLVGSSPGYS